MVLVIVLGLVPLLSSLFQVVSPCMSKPSHEQTTPYFIHQINPGLKNQPFKAIKVLKDMADQPPPPLLQPTRNSPEFPPPIGFHDRIPIPKSVQGKCGRSILWSRDDIRSNSTDVIGNFQVLSDAGYVASEPHEFPWQVWLSGRHFFNQSTACGGALVNKDWILTSANCCIALSPKALTIVGGWTSGFMNDKFSVKVSFMTTSAEIVVHPLAHATRMGYDFCLVKIASTLISTLHPFRTTTTTFFVYI